ncbi:MAG: hypothetical protein KDA89_25400 [Planctomycetaceae bacterium]|nr:hypothetical protein [Planctomycetaceae bacterium]
MCKRSYPSHRSSTRWRLPAAALLAAASLLALFALAIDWGRGHDLLDVRAGQSFACLSYSPWTTGSESPLKNDFISPERIERDLHRLRALTPCVRTYSSQLGLDAVPAIAARLGMQVLQGIWISRNPIDNQAEIDTALAAASAAPEAVRALVVGNEVLLRQEQTPQAMLALLEQVRARSPVPITYADVWEFWSRNEELASAVDFVTVHILPYWEDHPVGIDAAIEHVASIHAQMRERFAPKDILIGETGWPDVGRQRGPAQPGRIAQARFVRQWMVTAEAQSIDYNLIEAFDQPWKRAHEGAMGGGWGVLHPDGTAKFDLRGQLAEAPALSRSMWIGALAGLALGVLSVIGMRRAGQTPGRADRWSAVLVAAAFAIVALLLPWQLETWRTWNRDALEWIVSAGFTVLGDGALLNVALRSFRSAHGASTHLPNKSHGQRFPGRTEPLTVIATLLLLGAAYFALLHALDPRYRGFPISLYIAPTLALLIQRITLPGHATLPTHAAWLPALILAGAILMAWRGWPENQQAVTMTALLLAMAMAGRTKRPANSAGQVAGS